MGEGVVKRISGDTIEVEFENKTSKNETEIFNGKGFTTINKGTLFKNCHKNIKKYQKNLCKI